MFENATLVFFMMDVRGGFWLGSTLPERANDSDCDEEPD